MNHYLLAKLRYLVFPQYYAGIVINRVKAQLIFLGEHISTKLLSVQVEPGERIFIELTVLEKKWQLSCGCNPNRNNISNFLEAPGRSLDLYLADYKNLIVIRSFNTKLH